ncbi:MAG: elongation factor Ts [Lentimicrobiaceae bacterium]|nr:elongation factor Ts [Lentimicrobiaceae bacterium]
MTQITAADVNKLRQMTGAGMMDCKNALMETGGDFEAAIDYLRKKGQKIAAKRADRDANEGIVIARTNDAKTFGASIMLNCETDFVAKNVEFIDMAEQVINLAIANKPGSLDELKALTLNGRSIAEHLTELVAKTGEKMDIAHYEFVDAAQVNAYNHQGNRLATLLGMNMAGFDETGHEIAMQVAAMNPVAIDVDDVPEKVRERELEIGREQAREEGKPEDMLDKIALGKLNKFFKENTLLNQEFIRDSKLTVGQYLSTKDKNLKVVAFRRLMLGA